MVFISPLKAFHLDLRRLPFLRPVFFLCTLLLCLTPQSARAGYDSTPSGEPVLESPTLQSIGAYWLVQGDDNANATVSMAWR